MRKPFFENSRVRVFCGNSLEVIEELKSNGETFDLCLTDPPYGINQANEKPSGINAECAKAAYKDDLFTDDEKYLHDVVRPILDNALSISTLGIVTGGVECWKVYPPLSPMDVCTLRHLQVSIHGGTTTIGLFGITGSRKGILESIESSHIRYPNADFAKRIHAQSRWSFGRNLCCAEQTELLRRRFSTHSAEAEQPGAPRKIYV